jgi:hypothetical protein
MLLCCSRQSGKSLCVAALALKVALLQPGALVLLLAPSLRQSSELFRSKVVNLYDRLDRPVPGTRTQLSLTLSTGSRIVALPGDNEGNVRGFAAPGLIIVDEASRIRDDLLAALRPMLAVSGGALVLASTPFGQRGSFYQSWTGEEEWLRVRITGFDCPRISRKFLEDERAALGDRVFATEYLCDFTEAVSQCFSTADIRSIATGNVPPLWSFGS